ncbi:MAG: HNH endonuclease [Actinobacteria bacterium]|nr:HNH endonuclease [Actinomycetota bacterium]
MKQTDDQTARRASAAEVVGHVLGDLARNDSEANRQAALRSERILEVIDLARRNPDVYTHDADPGFAERAAVLDIALRLQLSEDQVRGVQATAEFATSLLPDLWDRARDGFASPTAVRDVVSRVRVLQAPVGAPEDVVAAACAAIAAVDAAASEWVLTCPPALLRRKVRALVDRLLGDRTTQRHTRAMQDRAVAFDEAGDGMSWLSIYGPTAALHAAYRRLSATAKHRQKAERDGRTRDQIRTDLAISWLTGEGTPTAVTTKVFVTIPVQLLAGDPVPVEQAEIVGLGPIDPLTARQTFLDAGSFRRVVTDPVRGVVVDMDRRTYRPTRAQRDWLILQHGTCARDGCSRLAVDADLDHDRPWAEGGTTDLRRLRPLCPRDHRMRHRTRTSYRTRPDERTVEVVTPTGFRSTAPPPF